MREQYLHSLKHEKQHLPRLAVHGHTVQAKGIPDTNDYSMRTQDHILQARKKTSSPAFYNHCVNSHKTV